MSTATVPETRTRDVLRTSDPNPTPVREATSAPAPFRGWGLYLAISTILVALPFAIGPGQITLLDVLNAVALPVFAVVVLTRRIPVSLPFATPMLVIGAASLLAVTAAISVPAALLTLVQDMYLYAWFVALVALMGQPRNLRVVRWTWVLTATLVALGTIVVAFAVGGVGPSTILSTGGTRIEGAFATPNMYADYLVISLFLVMGITGGIPRWLRVASLSVVVLALLMTKSNGGIISLAAGLAVWLLVRLWTSGIPRLRIVGAMALLLGVTIGAGWLVSESGAGGQLGRTVMEHTFAGRLEKSTSTRLRIWEQLQMSYGHSPLGIGPGNSVYQPVPIGARQRPDGSFVSKEAHSDYLGYAVERGPIALVALLLLTAQMWLLVARGRRRLDQWMGGPAAGSAQLACLLGAFTAATTHSLVIEKLHFRHWWLFLAMAVVMTAAGPAHARAKEDPATGPLHPSGAGGETSRRRQAPGRSEHERFAGTG